MYSYSLIWIRSGLSQRKKQTQYRWCTHTQINTLTKETEQMTLNSIVNMCHSWAVSLTSSVGLTSCGVIKRRRAVIRLGLPGIWCKSFPLHSSSAVDPVEVANCFSLLAWPVSRWPSSLPTLSWQQHGRSCPTYSCLCFFTLRSDVVHLCFHFSTCARSC